MPRGIVIIDWDEFEGGYISMKYPDIELPNNLIQQIQISHSFNPGIITIQENGFHAISIGNDDLQKVVVLVLEDFEDSVDFHEMMEQLNKVVSDCREDANLKEEIKRSYEISHSVFKAREAVLTKLANEITDLKNNEVNQRLTLDWLIRKNLDLETKLILLLLRHGFLPIEKLAEYSNRTFDTINQFIGKMEQNKLVEKRDGVVYLIIHFLI